MAVPKKRTGHSAQGKRRSNWKATKPATTKCPNCGETVLTHTVCTACGTYKGKAVSLKDRVEEVAVKEEKPAKKSTKKAEAVEEVKAEAEVVETVEAEVVETKEEAVVEAEVEAEEATETEEK